MENEIQKILSFIGKESKQDISWDDLMEAVYKIESLKVDGIYDDTHMGKTQVEYSFTVVIEYTQCTINREMLPQFYGTETDFLNLYDCRKTDKKSSVKEAVIAFIKWYSNSNTPYRG